jgi:hypothetical protein
MHQEIPICGPAASRQPACVCPDLHANMENRRIQAASANLLKVGGNYNSAVVKNWLIRLLSFPGD